MVSNIQYIFTCDKIFQYLYVVPNSRFKRQTVDA